MEACYGINASTRPERRCTRMSRILTLTLMILAALLVATNFTVSGEQVQTRRPITREELNAMTLKAAAPNIRSVAKILKDEKVDIDPELLFTRDGRKLLRPQHEKFPAM